MRDRRNLETIAGRVNFDGTIAAGDGFTVSKIAVGKYSVTMAPGFRLVAATASVAGFFYWVLVQNYSGNTFEVWTSSASTGGTAVDSAFQFIAAGVQQ